MGLLALLWSGVGKPDAPNDLARYDILQGQSRLIDEVHKKRG
jgi:hypothetical protein